MREPTRAFVRAFTFDFSVKGWGGIQRNVETTVGGRKRWEREETFSVSELRFHGSGDCCYRRR